MLLLDKCGTLVDCSFLKLVIKCDLNLSYLESKWTIGFISDLTLTVSVKSTWLFLVSYIGNHKNASAVKLKMSSLKSSHGKLHFKLTVNLLFFLWRICVLTPRRVQFYLLKWVLKKISDWVHIAWEYILKVRNCCVFFHIYHHRQNCFNSSNSFSY